MSSPHVIELPDLPPCDPNLSNPSVLSHRSMVAVVYEAKGDRWPDLESYAAIRFDGCYAILHGLPNDEALNNHPLYKYGVQFYAMQEVLDSPWKDERCRIGDRDGDPARLAAKSRHFLLAFKENTFECIARSYSTIGVFPLQSGAIDAALKSLGHEGL